MFLFIKKYLSFCFKSIVYLITKLWVIRKISSEISTVVAETVVNFVYFVRAALFLRRFVFVGGVSFFTFGVTADTLVVLTFNDYQLVAYTAVADFFVALVKDIRIYVSVR